MTAIIVLAALTSVFGISTQDDPRTLAWADAAEAFYECVVDRARRLEPSGEELESVADAAVALCYRERGVMAQTSTDMLENDGMGWTAQEVWSQTDGFVQDNVAGARARGLAEAMLQRAERAPR